MIDVMKQALEALDLVYEQADFSNGVTDPTGTMDEGKVVIGGIVGAAITALRQAIAEAEKQPSTSGVIFAVEQAIEAGDCPIGILLAYEDYEAKRKESALQEITDIGQWDNSDMAHRPGGLSVDMSTKPEKIDTSAERVHDIDILRQSEREGWRYAKECETEIERLKVIIYEFENDDLPKPQNELDAIDRAYFAGKEAGIAEVIKPWQRLTDEEIVACGWCDLRFARAIEAKLKEKNT